MLSTSKTYTRYSSPSWISVIPIFPHLNHHSCRKYFRFFSSQLSPPPSSRMPTRSPSPPSRTSALPGSGIPRSESNKNLKIINSTQVKIMFRVDLSSETRLSLVCDVFILRGDSFLVFLNTFISEWWLTCARGCISSLLARFLHLFSCWCSFSSLLELFGVGWSLSSLRRS